ncbi:hypothetical protein ACFVP3_38820 [Streptomyces sp. NPDC057806]|uniref:hypothetical protein n=1 Tax=Streptomyces sp. NPDC057806 TaxID=3346255 RepID=UPI0036738911
MGEKIQNIEVVIQTATKDRGSRTYDKTVQVDAGGQVFLGIAGREFRCRSADGSTNFAPGDKDTFVFGGDSTVVNSNINDPQQLQFDHVKAFPVYIRFGTDGSDNWCVERVDLTVFGEEGSLRWTAPALKGEAHLWMGVQSSLMLYLERR